MHSMMVAEMCPKEVRLQALLHDAAEAYLTDMPTPFKVRMPDYVALEERVWKAICRRFNLPEDMHPAIKFADRACLMAEADLFKPNRSKWPPELEDHPRAPSTYPYPTDLGEVRSRFLSKYLEYSRTECLYGECG